MFTKMTLKIAATASAIALASFATASETPEISEIQVDATYSAAQDGNAAALFPEITDDIRLAIAERITMSDDASDPVISVDVRKIALDGDTFLPDSAEFNELEGVVSITSQNGTLGDQTFPINIKAMTDETAVPSGYIAVPPSTDDFYIAMVTAFADNVADRLDTVNTAGDGVSR